jgi:hypothetical protein
MKIYEVEMCRRSYVIVTVEAESKKEAEEKAWAELTSDWSGGTSDDLEWDIESVKEATGDVA